MTWKLYHDETLLDVIDDQCVVDESQKTSQGTIAFLTEADVSAQGCYVMENGGGAKLTIKIAENSDLTSGRVFARVLERK